MHYGNCKFLKGKIREKRFLQEFTLCGHDIFKWRQAAESLDACKLYNITFPLSTLQNSFRKEAGKEIPPKDLILHLSSVNKLKVGGGWVLSEIPKKTREIIDKIGIEFKL